MALGPPNPLKRVWVEGKVAFGLWSVISGSFGAELLSGAEIDYVCVDQQHGLVGFDALVPMLQAIEAAGAAPVTRVLSGDPYRIMQSLDAGAWGVIVPMVNSPEEAASAVAACRYPPHGLRSWGPVRASAVVGSGEPDEVADAALCMVMVETREGLERVEEIAATPGLDGIYVGPSDLALSLGLAPTLEVEKTEHAEAIERIREACHKSGIAAGIHSPSGEWARRHAEAGFDMVTVATDASLLSSAALREVDVARGGYLKDRPGGGYS